MEKTITLTEEQQSISYSIIKSLRSGISCCLTGRAGVGTTTTMKDILSNFYVDEVVCAAPTHQACHVFRAVTGYRCCTLASLLAKRKEINYDTGEILFEPAMFIDEAEKVIPIDEASMISSKDRDTLRRNYPRCTFLFIGDKGQLPPIGEEDFCIFDEFPCYELMTNMRCGQGNIMFDNIERVYNNPVVNLRDIEIGGNTHKIRLDSLNIDDLIVTYYNSSRIVHNNFILDKYFGSIKPETKFIANDNLRYSKKTGTYVVTNGEMFFPQRVQPMVYELDYIPNRKPQIVKGCIITFRNTDLNYLPDRTILNSYLEYFKAKGEWRTYYRINDYFDNIDLGYAVTSHKVQGTTKETVSVDINDIMRVPTPKIKKASLYVAMSRASQELRLISQQ